MRYISESKHDTCCQWAPPGYVLIRDEQVPVEKAPLKILTWFLFKSAIRRVSDDCARELLRRHKNGEFVGHKTIARALMYCPPPCECGKKGIYIVGHRTFCAACKAKGAHRLRSAYDKIRLQSQDAVLDIKDREKIVTAAQKHHAAMGKRRRGYK